ncbi:hypothetical protein [Neisseria chenwenguii]|uniref:hypothetical protein n=1 Tax=Neisseria chenwenguii TaxID=1853278 RepID=UPI000F4F00FC|nr:hypothetical protein [Neisseria chenwenguii]
MMQQTKDDPFPFYLYRQFTSGTTGRVPRLTKAAFEAGSFVGYFDQKNAIPITRQTVISRLWPMRMQKATAVAVNTAAKR